MWLPSTKGVELLGACLLTKMLIKLVHNTSSSFSLFFSGNWYAPNIGTSVKASIVKIDSQIATWKTLLWHSCPTPT